MKTSQAGLDLIKAHEGLRLKAYRCPAGVLTIGYGTTSSAGVGKIAEGMAITKIQAESMLVRSLEAFEQGVLAALKKPPTQHQFDALVSFAYNVGVAAMAKSSVVRHLNAGDPAKAAEAFGLWVKAGGRVLPGLVKRRQAERDLFLKPDTAASATPIGKPPAR